MPAIIFTTCSLSKGWGFLEQAARSNIPALETIRLQVGLAPANPPLRCWTPLPKKKLLWAAACPDPASNMYVIKQDVSALVSIFGLLVYILSMRAFYLQCRNSLKACKASCLRCDAQYKSSQTLKVSFRCGAYEPHDWLLSSLHLCLHPLKIRNLFSKKIPPSNIWKPQRRSPGGVDASSASTAKEAYMSPSPV